MNPLQKLDNTLNEILFDYELELSSIEGRLRRKKISPHVAEDKTYRIQTRTKNRIKKLLESPLSAHTSDN